MDTVTRIPITAAMADRILADKDASESLSLAIESGLTVARTYVDVPSRAWADFMEWSASRAAIATDNLADREGTIGERSTFRMMIRLNDRITAAYATREQSTAINRNDRSSATMNMDTDHTGTIEATASRVREEGNGHASESDNGSFLPDAISAVIRVVLTDADAASADTEQSTVSRYRCKVCKDRGIVPAARSVKRARVSGKRIPVCTTHLAELETVREGQRAGMDVSAWNNASVAARVDWLRKAERAVWQTITTDELDRIARITAARVADHETESARDAGTDRFVTLLVRAMLPAFPADPSSLLARGTLTHKGRTISRAAILRAATSIDVRTRDIPTDDDALRAVVAAMTDRATISASADASDPADIATGSVARDGFRPDVLSAMSDRDRTLLNGFAYAGRVWNASADNFTTYRYAADNPSRVVDGYRINSLITFRAACREGFPVDIATTASASYVDARHTDYRADAELRAAASRYVDTREEVAQGKRAAAWSRMVSAWTTRSAAGRFALRADNTADVKRATPPSVLPRAIASDRNVPTDWEGLPTQTADAGMWERATSVNVPLTDDVTVYRVTADGKRVPVKVMTADGAVVVNVETVDSDA